MARIRNQSVRPSKYKLQIGPLIKRWLRRKSLEAAMLSAFRFIILDSGKAGAHHAVSQGGGAVAKDNSTSYHLDWEVVFNEEKLYGWP